MRFGPSPRHPRRPERTASGRVFLLALLPLLYVCPLPAARADEQKPILWREVWSGADASKDVWLIYSGATIAPASHIHQNGIRFRVTGGYGQYRYRDLDGGKRDTFEATTAFGDLLAGYLVRLDPLTLKVFAGATYIDHDISPYDRETIVTGGEWGVKGVVELWLNAGDKGWTSLDVSYATAHDTAALRLRSGYRVLDALSLGVEAGLNVDAQAQCKMRLEMAKGCRLDPEDPDVKSLFDFGRAGLFARYEWEGGEFSFSAGGLGQLYSPDEGFKIDPYVTVNWITQF
jgi:hypothetical protein